MNSPTITFRLPEPLRARLAAESARRGVTASDLIRELLAASLSHPDPLVRREPVI